MGCLSMGSVTNARGEAVAGAKGTAGGDQPNGCGGGLATQPRRRSRGDGSEHHRTLGVGDDTLLVSGL